MVQIKTMRAARFIPASKKVEIQEVPIPRPDDDVMLVKTIATGLCHSDMMVLDGTAPFLSTSPITIGHEAVGEVVELGVLVKHLGFSVGDKIGFLNGLRACQKCAGCAHFYGFCQDEKFRMQGFATDGFMAEYVIVDPKVAFVLPTGIDVVRMAPLCCAGITAYNSVIKAQLQPGQWVAVVGCGGLGQLALRYGKAKGLNVVGIDIDDEVLAVAQKAGIEHTFNTRKTLDTAETVKELTQNGADAVIVFTAVKAGYILAPKLIKVGGRLICVGCPPGQVSFDSVQLALEMFTIHGATNGAKKERLLECAEFTKENGIESPVKLFKLDQIGEMIGIMTAGKMGGNRLVVDFS